jgi:CheY-like chemotaxis protein
MVDNASTTARTILLVEDNPAHAALVIRSLQRDRSDHNLIAVDDGDAALDYLRGRGAYADHDAAHKPLLVLLDLRLPRRDGLEVLAEIKNDPKLEDVPVVVLTTSGADADVRRAYQLGANSYLVKPTAFARLGDLLTDVSTYWLKWNRVPWS